MYSHVRERKSLGERVFDFANVCGMLILCLATLYPFWYVTVLSLNEGLDATKGPIWFWPRKFTLDNYIYALHYPNLKNAFFVTIARAVVGAFTTVTVLLLAAYGLSKRFLPGRRAILYFLMIPMFISGSIVSNYVVMAKLGLLDNFFVYILPGAFGYFYMIIVRTFIEQMPEGLEESAMVDGASYFQILLRIIVPLSAPILATMFFFSIVGHWLDLSLNLLYVTDEQLYVLQYVLYLVVISGQSSDMVGLMMSSGTLPRNMPSSAPTPQVLKMATLVIVTMPLLFVYPFFQRYFIKGMYIGAIKG